MAGVNSDGRRELLGVTVGPSEAETFSIEFLRSPTRRGPGGVQRVISDAHRRLKAAVVRVLHAFWQRCRTPFMRNVLAHRGRAVLAAAARLPTSLPSNRGRRYVSAQISTISGSGNIG